MLNVKILEVLVCPLCKGSLMYESAEKELICNVDRLAFPFQGDIPVMLRDEARLLGAIKQ
jgi:uncharacterized protein YbaR (Trm112 family)